MLAQMNQILAAVENEELIVLHMVVLKSKAAFVTPVWIKWLVVVFIWLECNNLTWLRDVYKLNLKVPFMFSCIVAKSNLVDWIVLGANFFLDVKEVIASASEQI